VTNVCVTVTLTKTFAATQLGGENVLKDVSAAVSVFLEKKTVTMLGGTTVGTAVCSLAATECCEPAVETTCCPDNPAPAVLTATIVGGTHAGSYSAEYDGAAEWLIDAAAPVSSARLSCDSVLGWLLTIDFDNYTPSPESCDPFSLTFDITGSSITSATSITYTVPV
jgi:hypothetical protein